MNILMINPAHPSTPHISATRAWRLASELSNLGHRVILLCNAITADQINTGSDINTHNWRLPYVLSPAMLVSGDSRLPSAFRRIKTAALTMIFGGYQWRWQRAAISSAKAIAHEFKPDAIWATFGKLEAVYAARRIAKIFSVPWVLDLKDNWREFVPYGLRSIVSWRCRGFSSLTANASFTLEACNAYWNKDGEVIYSGVDEAYFDSKNEIKNSIFTVNIIGGLYFDEHAHDLMRGVAEFFSSQGWTTKNQAFIQYMGGDSERFNRLAKLTALTSCSENLGYLPIHEMAKHCNSASVNAYICNNSGFHHKLLELLAAGRPVIAYGGDIPEAACLATGFDVAFLQPCGVSEVVTALQNIYAFKCERPQAASATVEIYRWPILAKQLERVFHKLATL